MNYPRLDRRIKKEEDHKNIKGRVCLNCQKEFKSTHKFNRLCDRCKENLKDVGCQEEYIVSIRSY